MLSKGRKKQSKSASSLLALSIIMVASVLLFVFGLALLANQAQALSIDTGLGQTLGLGSADLLEVVISVVQWILGLLGLVAVIIMIYGGFIWMTAGGNEQKIAKAKKIIINGLIGLAIVLLAWAIVFFVMRVIGNASNGGTACGEITCEPGQQCCWANYCATSCGGGGSPPVPEFAIESITTDCELPSGNNYEGVYRCSAVSVNFSNGQPAKESIKLAVEKDELIVEQCDDANCTNSSLPAPLLDPQVYHESYPPTGSSGWYVNNESVIFYHPPALLEANTYYRVSIKETIEDEGGDQIEECLDAHCKYDSISGKYTWIFQTNDQVDSIPPEIAESYPVGIGNPLYPDRNVNRAPIIWVNFNENIDPGSIQLANITLTPLSSANVPIDPLTGGGGELLSPIPSEQLQIGLNKKGDGFELALLAPNLLTSFTWYEIKVDGIRDLCFNLMKDAPKTWRFETNDVAPGISSVYPRDGYAYACPSTQVYAKFNTSMYDLANGSCAVDPLGNGGYVENGILTPNPGRWLAVADDYPVPCDEGVQDCCKKYSFLETTTLFSVNTHIQSDVLTRMIIGINEEKLEARWGFDVTEPGKCADAPIIDRLSPDNGPPGQCFSIQGDNFGAVQGPSDKAEMETTTLAIKGWIDDNIATTAPAIGVGRWPVKVSVYNAVVEETLVSEEEIFDLRDGVFDGPCLYKLSPISGYVGRGVTLEGERFNPEPPRNSTYGAQFNNAIENDWNSWADTKIKGNVPNIDTPETLDDANTGEVQVVNQNGESNGIVFTVVPFDPNVPYVVEDDYCSETKLSSPSPYLDQEEACININLAARFTHQMDAATLENPNNVVVAGCDDTSSFGNCHNPVVILGTPKAESHNGGTDNAVVFYPDLNLSADTYYQVTLKKDIKNTFGYNLNENNDYVWMFKTQETENLCPVESISIQNGDDKMTSEDETEDYQGVPLGPNCQQIKATDYDWNWWSTNTSVARVVDTVEPETVATAQSNEGTIDICGRIDSEDKQGCRPLQVDLSSCEENYQCTEGGCDGSLCIDGKCTPVIMDISPQDGDLGTMVTLAGCHFSNYEAGKSKVIFTDNQLAVFPDPDICGSENDLWQNDQIVIEVPNIHTTETSDDAIAGPVRVESRYYESGNEFYDVTSDGDGFSGSFAVNDTQHPGLCRLVPDEAKPNTAGILAQGERFENIQNIGDRIEYPIDGGRTEASVQSWQDQEIEHTVPTNAVSGEVTVWKNSVESNPLNFTVSCSNNDDCTTDCCYDNECRPTAVCSTGGPGDLCDDLGAMCDYGPPNCLDGYSCLSVASEDCRCCCNPGPPPQQYGNLFCEADISPCSSASRGLYCGCETDDDCALVDEIGCGKKSSPYCCYPRPHLDSTNPAPGEEICRNRVIEVTFDTIMDASTFTGDNVQLQYYTDSDCEFYTQAPGQNIFARLKSLLRNILTPKAAVAGEWCDIDEIDIYSYLNGDKTVLAVAPTSRALPASSDIRVRLKYDDNIHNGTAVGLLNQYGVGLNGQAYTGGWYEDYQFSTSSTLCELNHVDVLIETSNSSVESKFDLYTCNSNECDDDLQSGTAGNQHRYVAHAEDAYNNSVTADYNWTDTDSPNNVIHLDDPGDQDTYVTSDFSIHPESGIEYAQVEADAGEAGKMTVSVQATVNICENPWPEDDPFYYPNSFPGQDEDTNFLTYFCKDGLVENPDDLTVDFLDEPHNSVYTVISGDGKDSLLREVFFKVSESGEHLGVIGIRVYENELKIPPQDWYAKQFPQEGAPGGSILVDNYQAVQVGRTIYVDAANSADYLYLNVYLMSYNEGADAKVQNIYNQLTENWFFNTNLDPIQKPGLARDTFRVMDLGGIANALLSYYETNGFYPELESGSYLEGLTTSKWPSWQARLGNELGKTLPVDPVGKFGDCGAGYDPDTCWNETDKLYYCPTVDSHIYQYMFEGTEAYLYANLEYGDSPNWQNFTSGNACDPPHRCDCFNYQINSIDGFISSSAKTY